MPPRPTDAQRRAERLRAERLHAEERRNYQKLERRLVLLGWLNGRFGFANNGDLLEFAAEAGEGFDEEGRGYATGLLLGRGAKCRVPRADLERYDDNIRHHLGHLNRLRTRPVVLKYFQHLALLYAELYLDAWFHRRGQLLAELNAHVRERNIDKLAGEPEDAPFTETELSKLAYWMATGSGKTLLFHVNYLQYRHYAREAGAPIDNILLVTPNENLTEQHLEEMAESDIPCARFSLEGGGLGESRPGTVRVIEITKLVTEKTGGGLSVPVEAFEGNNLVFVDEGHKGTGSDAQTWRDRRQALARGGFTFEYSATFGQALDAAKSDAVTAEYAKSILFDYSYKYFYRDGFGKDFHILNLKDYEDEESVHTLLLANLLSFYEQRAFFHAKEGELQRYHVEPPLWLQICSKVSATNAEVVTVLQFLARFTVNQRGWAVRRIAKILKGESGVETVDGQDLFAGHLPWLRAGKRAADAEKVYHDILSRVFQSATPGELEIKEIKSGKGEVGLRVSGSEIWFGLLAIGDVGKFKKIVEKEAPDLTVGEDSITAPLFPHVKKPSSKVTLLIGAKRFMEGWSSWRVSNIGLLNVGVSEGSEIIQLFGRGVRLKGRDFCLKRSGALRGIEHPPHLKLLETLNIFAVRANYMAKFRDYLEREGVDTGGYVEMDLPLWTNRPFLEAKLYRPRIANDRVFADECDVVVGVDPAVKVRLDVTTRVKAYTSAMAGGMHEAEGMAGHVRKLSERSIAFLDWRQLHRELVEYAESRGFRNLTIPRDFPRGFFTYEGPALYELAAPDEWVEPDSWDAARRLHETAASILRKYVERHYRNARQKWESQHMAYEAITVKDENFQDYRVSISRSDPGLVKTIREIVEEAKKLSRRPKPERIFGGDHAVELPNLHFEHHLYQPLLIAKRGVGDRIQSTPPGLNEGETRFLEDLRSYWKAERNGTMKGRELFVLRNLGRGKGIGFFETRGFYPDFILWIKEGAKQRIVFVEPHGMLLEQGGIHSEKLKLGEKLREHSKAALSRSGLKQVTVDAFVVSVTGFDELSGLWLKDDGSRRTREEFAESGLLFQEREAGYDYVARLLDR